MWGWEERVGWGWRAKVNSWNVTQISEDTGGWVRPTGRAQCRKQQEMAPRSQMVGTSLIRTHLGFLPTMPVVTGESGDWVLPWLCPSVGSLVQKSAFPPLHSFLTCERLGELLGSPVIFAQRHLWLPPLECIGLLLTSDGNVLFLKLK